MYKILETLKTRTEGNIYDLAVYTTGQPEETILELIEKFGQCDSLIIRVYRDLYGLERLALAVWDKGQEPIIYFDDPDIRADLRRSFM